MNKCFSRLFHDTRPFLRPRCVRCKIAIQRFNFFFKKLESKSFSVGFHETEYSKPGFDRISCSMKKKYRSKLTNQERMRRKKGWKILRMIMWRSYNEIQVLWNSVKIFAWRWLTCHVENIYVIWALLKLILRLENVVNLTTLRLVTPLCHMQIPCNHMRHSI